MPGGDATDAADLAAEAEQAGWDGFFVWDGIWSIDAWVSLAACAMRTSTIKLGTMLTPLPRRKPWDVASQVATLDNLAAGRVILAVGLGADDDRWNLFEDIEDRRVRAEKLDEGLDLITGLWSGEPFSYQGRHYRAKPTEMMVPPPPVQRPRPPIWVVGLWPATKSMRRVARWDGWLPNYAPPDAAGTGRPPADALADGVRWLRQNRIEVGLGDQLFDVITEGTTPATGGAEMVRPFAEAGATWWLEADWTLDPSVLVETCRERLRAGPPRI
jgi:alkanesulfonate monooxygenase SsuD/methylene tetrahydromethanopterin reductase-like flavin-dependent oxidoreductase (luciferase family)